jgi:hypothetical protein
MCWKCCDVLLSEKLDGSRVVKEAVGCKNLTAQAFEDGNCPLIVEEEVT